MCTGVGELHGAAVCGVCVGAAAWLPAPRGGDFLDAGVRHSSSWRIDDDSNLSACLCCASAVVVIIVGSVLALRLVKRVLCERVHLSASRAR